MSNVSEGIAAAKEQMHQAHLREKVGLNSTPVPPKDKPKPADKPTYLYGYVGGDN